MKPDEDYYINKHVSAIDFLEILFPTPDKSARNPVFLN